MLTPSFKRTLYFWITKYLVFFLVFVAKYDLFRFDRWNYDGGFFGSDYVPPIKLVSIGVNTIFIQFLLSPIIASFIFFRAIQYSYQSRSLRGHLQIMGAIFIAEFLVYAYLVPGSYTSDGFLNLTVSIVMFFPFFVRYTRSLGK